MEIYDFLKRIALKKLLNNRFWS